MIQEGDACQVGEILLELEVDDDGSSDTNQSENINVTQKEEKSNNDTQNTTQSNYNKKESSSHNKGITRIPIGVDFYSDGILASPAVRDHAYKKGVNINLVKGSGHKGRILKEDINNYRPGKVLATPAVRKLAMEMGIDLSAVLGTGENGRVLKDDLFKFEAGRVVGVKEVKEEVREVRKEVKGEKEEFEVYRFTPYETGMVKSMNYSTTVPQFYLGDEYDITQLVKIFLKSFGYLR